MPPTVARYVENRNAVALSKSTSMLRVEGPSLRSAIAAATPASTAFSAVIASVCFSGLGKYGLPVLAVEKCILEMCGRASCGRWSLDFASNCSRADFVPSSRL